MESDKINPPTYYDVKESFFKGYGYTGSADIITPEIRARLSNFSDPVTLNFKLMIDWNKPYGLFADESNINSALAYLERIGESARKSMLQIFINKFKDFIKNYDFLILSVDGLSEIVNRKPNEFPKEGEDKVSIVVRETADLRIQSLLTAYRQIWYDDIRGVEVLPANLRRFDCLFLVYSAGYYSMALYDAINENESYSKAKNNGDYEKIMFPTIKKLAEVEDTSMGEIPFNHNLISISDASFVNEDSGKPFFSELSNEMNSDFVKNNMTITYRFATYSGIFHNITGSINYAEVLKAAAIASKATNAANVGEIKKEALNKYMTSLVSTGSDKTKDIWDNVESKIKSSVTNKVKGLTSQVSMTGNALNFLKDPSQILSAVGNAMNAGIEHLEEKYINSNLAKLNNLVSGNFSENMLTDMVLNATKKKIYNDIELLSPQQKTQIKNTDSSYKGITFFNENIYKQRESF